MDISSIFEIESIETNPLDNELDNEVLDSLIEPLDVVFDSIEGSSLPSLTTEGLAPSLGEIACSSRDTDPILSSSSFASCVLPEPSEDSSRSDDDAPIYDSKGELLSFETFQGNIDISKCVNLSLNSLKGKGATDNDRVAEFENATGGTASLSLSSSSSASKRKVSTKGPRKPNPDSELISQATEQTLALMGLEPNSKEGKAQRRRIRNQMSAQLHRERKKQYIEALESCIRDRDVQIRKLQAEIKCLYANGVQHRSTSPSSASVTSTSQSVMPVSPDGSNLGDTDRDDFEITGESNFSSGPDFKRARCYLDREDDSDMSSVSSHGGGARITKTSLTLFSTVLLGLSLTTMKSPFTSMDAPGGVVAERGLILGDAGDWYPSAPDASAAAPASAAPSTKDMLMLPESQLSTARRVRVVRTEQPAAVAGTSDWRDPESALWQYDDGDAVALLFPGNTSTMEHADGPPPSAPDAGISSRQVNVKRRGYLRASDTTTAAATSTVVVPVVHPWLGESTASSHVLMTQGRALLDPTFLTKAHVYKTSTKRSEHPHMHTRTHAHDDLTKAVSTWTGAAGPVVSVRSTDSASHRPDAAFSESGGPQLVMMVPASSVRWGASWADSEDKDGHFASILKDLNDTTEPSAEANDLWVEIGCSVIKAQLVRNVNTAL